MSAKPTIVLADDSKTVRTLVARILSKAGFNVIEAVDGLDALAKIALERPHLAVLDHEMPGCTGLEVLRRMKAQPGTSDIPILILTGVDEKSAAAEAIRSGAADFVRKPCEPGELVARVRKASDERLRMIELDRQSSTDPLTGLPNRRGMEPVLAALDGPPGAGTGLIIIDLDHFKRVNDTLGHDVGDLVLRTVAGRLSATAGHFTVARWGGEEFVAAGRCAGMSDLAGYAERMREAICVAPCQFDQDGELVDVPMTASLGAVLVPDGGDMHAALIQADAALYAAKESGRNRIGLMDDGVIRGVDQERRPVSSLGDISAQSLDDDTDDLGEFDSITIQDEPTD